MNINDLFCTPNQGLRLAGLVSGLTSAFVWVHYYYNSTLSTHWSLMKRKDYEYSWQHLLIAPAFTLQELRDVCSMYDLYEIEVDTQHTFGWPEAVSVMDAPDLAAWIIERLETTP